MKSHAFWVGLGIFLSRISGLIRERVFAHFFGNSDAGDAFKAALKIPNFLQNLFGEGVLSASFIPVYAELLAKKHDEDAAQVASVVGSILFILTSVLVLFGVMLTPILIGLIAPGFQGEKKELTIQIVQILFPGTGFLVMSAWCLGILNSHKRFFLSYVAPVVWNLTIIFALIIWGTHQNQVELARTAAWGLVVGSLLQFIVQLPTAMRLGKKIRPSLNTGGASIKPVFKNFVPAVVARGVVQVSAYIDNIIASLLPTGAVSSLAYAQTIYLLPISLFGMSVSAAELPNMSQAQGSEAEVHKYLRERLNQGLEKIAFFIIPSAVAFVVLGNFIVGALFQTGAFNEEVTKAVWLILACSSFGLLASTLGRLYVSAFYSLKDTKTPLMFALLRVFSSTILGFIFALKVPSWMGWEQSLGTAALMLSSGAAGWVEYKLLRKKLNHKIGETGLSLKFLVVMWFVSLFSAGLAAALLRLSIFEGLAFLVQAFLALSIYGFLFFSLSMAFKIGPAKSFQQRLFRYGR